MLNEVGNAFSNLWNTLIERIPSIVSALVVLALFWAASRIGASFVRKLAARTGMARNLVELLVRIGSFLVLVFGLLFAAVIVFPSFRIGDLVAGLGLSSVAIGFAFKDILQNFIAGLFLLWRQPFKVGDEIVAAGFSGKVEEITARSTRIHTYDGERAVIPNADVYTQAVLVRTAFGKRRSRFSVGIGYPDSIEEARKTILNVLEGIDGLHSDPGPWVYVTELAGSSVNFTVFYWTDDDQRSVLRVSDQVATGIKLALDAAGIDMPFPHQVVLFHDETKEERQ
ncbi:mechanosensitive ion channel family protein [bacterium]|nr:MAG: mechanosensitive ion channel family protein [bacterium]